MKRLAPATAAFLILSLASCGYYLERLHEGEVAGSGLDQGRLGFAEVKAAVFDPYCVRCHRQYENYAGVKPETSSIAAAVNSGRMPKGIGPLPVRERQILNDWINAGAPEGSAGLAPLPLAPEWSSLAQNVFFPRCVACHNPSGQARFLDLSTREAVLAAAERRFGGTPLFDVNDPANSYMLEVVQDELEPMPPASSNFRRLDGAEIDTLTEWIRRGLP